jgi:curved DNA-binding protein
MNFKDYYSTLDVPREASAEEIKRAYRRLARKYHPDVSKEADAEAKFKELGEAYEVLRDPEKRTAYDQLGADWKAGQEFRPPPGADGRRFHFSTGEGAQHGDFSDFFEALFGRGSMAGMGGDPRGTQDFHFRRAGPARGEDQQARIRISLEDAFHGASRTVDLRLPTGETRSMRVAIPRGVTDGQRIRLAGQGTAGLRGGPGGDLYLEVQFEPHARYVAEGRNILLTLPVAPWEAALGETIAVPTLGGRVDLKIPPGSQSGRRLRLKGRGLPGKPAGDQIVTLRIDTPPADSETAREFYEQMRRKLPFNPRRDMEG